MGLQFGFEQNQVRDGMQEDSRLLGLQQKRTGPPIVGKKKKMQLI